MKRFSVLLLFIFFVFGLRGQTSTDRYIDTQVIDFGLRIGSLSLDLQDDSYIPGLMINLGINPRKSKDYKLQLNAGIGNQVVFPASDSLFMNGMNNRLLGVELLFGRFWEPTLPSGERFSLGIYPGIYFSSFNGFEEDEDEAFFFPRINNQGGFLVRSRFGYIMEIQEALELTLWFSIQVLSAGIDYQYYDNPTIDERFRTNYGFAFSELRFPAFGITCSLFRY